MGNWIYNLISESVVAMIRRSDIESALDNVEKQMSGSKVKRTVVR